VRSFSIRGIGAVCGLLVAWVCSAEAVAQPQHERTVIVDKTSSSSDRNFTSIQAAINAVNAHPESEGTWTILVYPGVYQEGITLGARKFIEIQGVARDSVVIEPPQSPNGTGNGMTFAGGQTGTVGYRVANLTIHTADSALDHGHAVVFNFDPQIDPPVLPEPNGIGFDNVMVRIDGESSDGFLAMTTVVDVSLRGVTVRAPAFTSHMVNGGKIKRLSILNCDFLAIDGFVQLGNDAQVLDSRIVIDRTFGSAPQSHDDAPAIQVREASGVLIRNTTLESRYAALLLQGATNVVVRDCVLRGGNFGVSMPTNDPKWGISPGVSEILIENCSIAAQSSRGVLPPGLGQPYLSYRAVWVQSPEGAVTVRGCEIFAAANRFPLTVFGMSSDLAGTPIVASSEGVVVETDTNGIAPAGGAVVLEGCSIRSVTGPDGGTDATGVLCTAKSGVIATGCTISARQTWANETVQLPRKAYGVVGTRQDAVSLVGGRISTFDVSERENDQFDVRNDSTSEVRVRVHGTAMSKFKGAIGSSERQRIDVQRMVSVAGLSNIAILPAKMLTTVEQVFDKTEPSLSQPDNYRVLTATLIGIQTPGITMPVTIIGTNWAGEQIAETVNVSASAEFQKPFRTVTKIFLPPRGAPGQQISIGISSRLGLHFPVTNVLDMLLVSKSVSNAAFLPESFNPADLDLVNHTMKIPTITAGASYEFTYRASE